MKAAGHDVIGLGAGEPDFDTPAHIKDAAKRALDQGFTKYAPVGGTPELKNAIIEKFRRDNGLEYKAEQILVSCGAKQSLFNLAQAVLDKGDQVVIPAPYWVSYPAMAALADAESVIIDTSQEDAFKITPEKLEHALSEHTRLVLLNSPSNPSGKAYTRDELAALGEVLKRYPDVLIATDDIYEHIRWTGKPFVNIVNACPELMDRTMVVNGVSKVYAMTGWRIGYVGGPVDVAKAMTKIQSQSTSGAATMSQKASEAALSGDQSFVDEMLKAFKERHDYVVSALNDLPGVSCLPSDGTFYAFPSFHEAIARMDGVEDDTALCETLIEKAGVALVPGSAFGTPGHLRLSFATSMENLEKAMARLADTLG